MKKKFTAFKTVLALLSLAGVLTLISCTKDKLGNASDLLGSWYLTTDNHDAISDSAVWICFKPDQEYLYCMVDALSGDELHISGTWTYDGNKAALTICSNVFVRTSYIIEDGIRKPITQPLETFSPLDRMYRVTKLTKEKLTIHNPLYDIDFQETYTKCSPSDWTPWK